MKRALFLLIVLLLVCAAFGAPALTDPIPDEVKALMKAQQEDAALIQDCIALAAPDDTRFVFTLSIWGSLKGYKKEGTWQLFLDTVAFDNTQEKLRFARLPSAEGLGFSVREEKTGRRLSYRWDGQRFRLSHWLDPDQWDGSVFVEGRTLRYVDSQGRTLASVTADDEETLHGWTSYWPRKPATPSEAVARADIQKSAVRHRFDGWTLGSFEALNSGAQTQAGYYRLENGLLTIRRAVFHAGSEEAYHDSISVPLSASLLQRLEEGPIDDLMDVSGNGDTFLTEDALDAARIPVTGKVLQNDLQRNCIILLVEDKKSRFLYTVRQNSSMGYDIEKSLALPEDASLDTFHAGDGALSLQWNSQNMQAGYRDTGTDWQLEWVMTGSGLSYSVTRLGVTLVGEEGQTTLIGDFSFRYLSAGAPALLPRTPENVRAAVDATHWAAVSNPDPKDRLHLRLSPDKNAPSLGKCWNGTPVYVLARQDEWTQVRLGSEEGGLTGWMMSRYLAFDQDASKVERAFPNKVARAAYSGQNAYRDAAMTALSPLQIDGNMSSAFIVGVTGNDLYLLLDDSGHVGYAPQRWFWDGNG